MNIPMRTLYPWEVVDRVVNGAEATIFNTKHGTTYWSDELGKLLSGRWGYGQKDITKKILLNRVYAAIRFGYKVEVDGETIMVKEG
jgi:hypothetical protein